MATDVGTLRLNIIVPSDEAVRQIDAVERKTEQAARATGKAGRQIQAGWGYALAGVTMVSPEMGRLVAITYAAYGAATALGRGILWLSKAQNRMLVAQKLVIFHQKVQAALTALNTKLMYAFGTSVWLSLGPVLIALAALTASMVYLYYLLREHEQAGTNPWADWQVWLVALLGPMGMLIVLVAQWLQVGEAVSRSMQGWALILKSVVRQVDALVPGFENFAQALALISVGDFEGALDQLRTAFVRFSNWFVGQWDYVGAMIGAALTQAAGVAKSIFNWIGGATASALNALLDLLNSMMGMLAGAINWLIERYNAWVPEALQLPTVTAPTVGHVEYVPVAHTGAMILSPGLVNVLAGEMVVPARTAPLPAGAGGPPEIRITVDRPTVVSPMDVDDMMDQIEMRLQAFFEGRPSTPGV